MFATDDTIVAIATPPGHGGIGIVRVSGGRALAIGEAILWRPEAEAADPHQRHLEPRHATFARVRGGPRTPGAMDQAVVTFFPAPHSYTGEDTVELSTHGSPVVLQAVVEAAMAAGARAAQPGEFTLRAFLNGRMDLVQAEAVRDLIEAVTPAQARAAFDQLEGTLTAAIGRVDAALFALVARLEASVDFPDEGYHFVAAEEVRAELDRVAGELERLLADAARGRVLREGRQVVIAGKPNVGKSTLFNRLLGSERAIVTALPGTTRDIVTEMSDVGGVRVRLVDTAGIRQRAADEAEREGVRRAMAAATVADAVIVVLDASRPLDEEDRALLESTEGRRRVVVASKRDLPAAWQDAGLQAVAVAAGEDAGVSDLKHRLVSVLGAGVEPLERPAVTNARHAALIDLALEAVNRAREGSIGRAPEEILLSDLRLAVGALEQVTGRRDDEDLLREIFSKFCIGK